MARVLIITVVHEPDTVSTATIATRLARGLQDCGHDVAVLSSIPHYNPPAGVRSQTHYRASIRHPIRIQDEQGVRVVRCLVPQKPRRVARRAVDFMILHVVMTLAVLRHLRDREVTIVISPPFTLALVGMLARRLGHGRLVYNAQELWPDVPRDLGVIRNRGLLAVLGRMERWIYRSADRVVAIGPGFARTIVGRGAQADHTLVIPNFVDNQRIFPTAKVNPLSLEWKVADHPVVLYAGNIGLTQDFDTLLRAAALLEAAGVRFVIVGGGAARSVLEARIEQSRPANVILKPFVPPEQVSDLYGLADVVAVPLRAGHDRTTTPSKIFSAMAAQRPLVACAAPDTDLAATIVQAKAGLVVPPGEPGTLAEGIATLLSGAANGAWNPEAALAAARLHSPSAIAARYDEVLRSLNLASGSGRTAKAS